MAAFFDRRADSYDEHMRRSVVEFDAFYRQIAEQIEPTEEPVAVLDLGCGTGLELAFIFDRAPNARVTAVDLSPEMLTQLTEKYAEKREQITVVVSSYLELDIEPGSWDVIISAMTLHHLTRPEKMRLYQTIHRGLKPGGRYVEGDYLVSKEEEGECLERYRKLQQAHSEISRGAYHIDIPFSAETQRVLFSGAGFSEAEVVWKGGEAAVFLARK
jgi:tRNA (cmo5U34)-methyltransferase